VVHSYILFEDKLCDSLYILTADALDLKNDLDPEYILVFNGSLTVFHSIKITTYVHCNRARSFLYHFFPELLDNYIHIDCPKVGHHLSLADSKEMAVLVYP